jgi:hypothetical protein
VVGIVGGGEDLGEGEDVEGVGQDGGGGFGGQASGPVGGIQAVEEFDAAGGVLEGAEAADAEQGGVAGSAEGPQAPAGLLEGVGAAGDQVGDGLEGDGFGVQSQRATWGSFQWAWRVGRSCSPTGVRSRRAVWRVGAMAP